MDYLPLSALMSVLTEADCTRAKDNLEEAISEKNRSVHVLGSNSSNWKNKLITMKEDALIFSITVEAEENQRNNKKSSSRASAGQGSYDKLLDEKEGKSSLLGGSVEGL